MTTHPVTTITTNTTIDFGYEYYLIDASLNSITITLPSASISDGLIFGFKRIDINTNSIMEIVGDTVAETIDGATSLNLDLNQSVSIISSGSVWYIN